jgi:hypothetical protein
MSEPVNQILLAFDALAPSDQTQVVAELLRRTVDSVTGDIQEEALVAAADALFLELDATI